MADTKRELRNAILLLDNSGLLLHPSGQKDLLKIFGELSEDNQIVFTTHSPYLIDRTKLDGIRIVKKEKEIGSILLEKFHDSDFDSLEPIRSAFGIAIGDSLFGSKENIIVEGFSDYQILEGLAYYFKRKGYESIDISKTSIISVGGADKVPYYALLVWKEGYDFVTVLDNDNEGRKVANELKEKFPLDENQIIKLDKVVPEDMRGIDIAVEDLIDPENQIIKLYKVVPEDMRGIDIAMEDLIDPPFYNCAVNRAYKELIEEKLGKKEINIDELDNSIKMQDKRYSKYFWENKKLGSFDKILVAKEIRNILTNESIDDGILGENTIRNFEGLFVSINKRFE
jgi:predicted ATP-dependent endonuclease of OLD family